MQGSDEKSTTSPVLPRLNLPQFLSLVALLAIALFLRVYRIETETVWFDESVTFLSLDRSTPMEFFRAEAKSDPLAVPVYFGSAYVWHKLGFTSAVGVRMLSVLAGMLGIVIIYLFGARLFGHMGGMTAALCMSLAKLQIYMSQEIRNYAFTMLFAVIAMYALYEALRTGRRRWWTINIIANGLLCLTHYLAMILLFAEGLYLLATRPKRIVHTTLWSIAHLPFLLFIPLWIHLAAENTIDTAASWIGNQPISRAFKAYYFVFAGSLQDAMDFIRFLPFGIPVQHILGIAFMIAGAAFVSYFGWAWMEKKEVVPGYKFQGASLLLTWLFVPPATLFIVARLVRPCFIERYVLYSSLALFLIMGGAIAALPRKSWQYAALALLALVYAGNLVDYPRPLRHDHILTGEVLRKEYVTGERLYMCFGNSSVPMAYYTGVPTDHIIGEENFTIPAIDDALDGKRAWLWFVEVPTRFEHEQIEAKLTSLHVPFQKWEFPGRWQTFLYCLEAAGDAESRSSG